MRAVFVHTIRLSFLCLGTCLIGCPQQPLTAQTPDLKGPDLAITKELANPTEKSPIPESILMAQVVPPGHAEGSVYSIPNNPLPPPSLPPGPGRELVESFCVACHSLRYLIMQPPLSDKQWEAEVDKMIQAYGAVVPDEVRPRIVGYLQAQLGPKSVPPVLP